MDFTRAHTCCDLPLSEQESAQSERTVVRRSRKSLVSVHWISLILLFVIPTSFCVIQAMVSDEEPIKMRIGSTPTMKANPEPL